MQRDELAADFDRCKRGRRLIAVLRGGGVRRVKHRCQQHGYTGSVASRG